MTDPATENTPDKPLDPAVLRIQKRVTRLMLIAGLTLGVGLLTVFGAIIYRLAIYPGNPQAAEAASPVPSAAPAAAATAVVESAPAAASESPAGSGAPVPAPAAPASAPAVAKAIENAKSVLPARAWLVSVAIDGNRILLAYEHANGTTMFVVDASTLEITGRLDLKPQ